MPVERFLGGAWASVHGPAVPRELILWTLDSGFSGLMPGPTPRPVDWAGVRAQLADVPASLSAMRVGSVLSENPPGAGLASSRDGDRQATLEVIGDAVREAQSLGCRRVVLEPGLVAALSAEGSDLGDPTAGWSRDRAAAALAMRNAGLHAALDGVCRSLFTLCKSFSDIEFCLVTGRNARAVADRAGLEAIFEDLAAYPLGYWHDAPVVARRTELLGGAPGEWLETFSNRLRGITLGDTAGGELYLPPGVGGVDYAELRSYVQRFGRPVPAVLELDPGVDPGEIPGVHAFLDKFGL